MRRALLVAVLVVVGTGCGGIVGPYIDANSFGGDAGDDAMDDAGLADATADDASTSDAEALDDATAGDDDASLGDDDFGDDDAASGDDDTTDASIDGGSRSDASAGDGATIAPDASGSDASASDASAASDGGIPTGAHEYFLTRGATLSSTAGAGYAYDITADGTSNGAFTIKWTGLLGAPATFTGSLWTTGTFTSLTPGCSDRSCAIEAGDTISQPIALAGGGQRIDWSTTTSSAYDGFSVSTENQPLYVDMMVNGVRSATIVHFISPSSAMAVSPAAVPFSFLEVTVIR